MKRFLSAAILIAMLLATLSVGAQAPDQRYVVVFNRSGVPRGAAQMIEAAGGELARAFPQVGVAIATSSNPDFAGLLRGARGIHSVGVERFQTLPAPDLYVTENGPQPEDDYYVLYQWDIRRVQADLAWDVTTGSHDTVVAVLDTGIAYNHPDLAPNVVYNACFSVYGPCIPYPSYHWHGTHVAGTIAAAFGGGGAVGVGPNLGLANYNVFEIGPDGFGASDEALWEAMLDAAAQGFDVINMSLGGYIVRSDGPEDVAVWTAWNRIADYVTRRGVTIVASAGNANVDLNGPLDHIPSDVTGIICTGATGIRPDPVYPQEGAYDVRAFYSNYGAAVTLAAPGGDLGPDGTPYPFPAVYYLVFSTDVYPDPVCAATASCPLGYAWAGGTSQAVPHVAGAAGLLKDLHPRLNPHQVTSILKETAQDLGDRQQFGHGMLDVYGAVTFEFDD